MKFGNNHQMQFANQKSGLGGEWFCVLRRCEWIGRFPVQIPLGVRPFLRIQPHYEAPIDQRVKNW